MLRKLLTLCSAVSLLLCVAVCVLWVRSYFVFDRIEYRRRTADDRVVQLSVHPVVGLFSCSVIVTTTDARFDPNEWLGSPFGWSTRSSKITPDEFGRFIEAAPYYRLLDFRLPHERGKSFTAGSGTNVVNSSRSLAIPYWVIVLFLGAPPLGWWVRHRRARRRGRAGLCPACGYDLRATPDRCPECGAAFA